MPSVRHGASSRHCPSAARCAERRSSRRSTLQPEGILHSVATVHLYQGHDLEAPFAIGEIQLDGGPLIRGTMTALVEPDAIGARVAAEWVTLRTDDDGNEVVEPRFGIV